MFMYNHVETILKLVQYLKTIYPFSFAKLLVQCVVMTLNVILTHPLSRAFTNR